MTARKEIDMFYRRQIFSSFVLAATLAGVGCGGDDTGARDAGRDASHAEPDADGDTISDTDEGRDLFVASSDADADGIPDYQDRDSDGDGLLDSLEAGDALTDTAPVDTDGDGAADFRDVDADDNGIGDLREGTGDVDGDGAPDFRDLDDDGDTSTDVVELDGRAEFPRDTDDDGIPDFRDVDSDGDTIGDRSEWPADTDADLLPDARDLDSDNDGVTDSVEAGDADLLTAPVDTDSDGTADFRDPDSDADGLPDAVEFERGTSSIDADSDDDGVSDLIEVGAGTDALDATDNPRARGDFVFMVPFDEPPMPLRDTVRFRTNVQVADVYFLIDTTGSMSGEIAAMRGAVAEIIDELTCTSYGTGCTGDGECEFHPDAVCSADGVCISDPAVSGCIASLWTGVGRYEGNPDSYQNLSSLAADPSLTQSRIPLSANGGGASESLYESIACVVDPTLCTALGCTVGGVGCPSFRTDALRILVTVTDENNQCTSCSPNTAPEVGAVLRRDSITLVGINAGTDAAAERDLRSVLEAAGSIDASGAPLYYVGDAARVVDAVVASINTIASNVPLYVTIDREDEPGDAGDALQFIDRLEVNITAGDCALVDEVADVNPRDGYGDTFPELLPGTRVCWDVVVRENRFVRPGREPQLFRARLTVRGDGSPLDARTVYFLVPPAIEIPPPLG